MAAQAQVHSSELFSTFHSHYLSGEHFNPTKKEHGAPQDKVETPFEKILTDIHLESTRRRFGERIGG